MTRAREEKPVSDNITRIDSTFDINDPLLTRPVVGRQLGGASAERVQRLIDSGDLFPAYRIGGRVVIPQSAVDSYMERSRIGQGRTPLPTIGGGLFYDHGLHLVAGPHGCGATWLALSASMDAVPAVQVPGRGPAAVYLHLGGDRDLPSRLGDLGLSQRAETRGDVALFDLVEETAKRGEGMIATLRAVVDGLTEAPPHVVVIDSLPEIMAEAGEDFSDAALLRMFDALSKKSCVILLDSVGKRGQLTGSATKVSAARVVLAMEPREADGPDVIAAAVVSRVKDRDGGIRDGLLVIDRDEEHDGRVGARFTPAA